MNKYMGRLIDREKLIAEYDRVHIGPPGGARKLMEDAEPVASISLEFIEGYIKQLEKLDAPLAKNDINGIKTMVTAWKLSQSACGPDYCNI